ncbi:MAG: S8 family serine peptidase [Gammaproteobacteria bacterium]|nr:S8 family serine peptidase [Gammaproteobacteria bacterium]
MMPARRLAGGACTVLALGWLAGCGGDASHENPLPSRPGILSLTVVGDSELDESANPRVTIRVEHDRFAAAAVTVALELAGTASLGRDYILDDQTVTIPASGSYATAVVDVYRDFVEEADETIEIGLGAITGNALASDASQVSLTILDGGPGVIEEPDRDANQSGLNLLPLSYTVVPDGVVLTVVALNSLPTGETVPLVAEWSTDFRFRGDVRRIGEIDVKADDDPLSFYFNVHSFVVPAPALAPEEVYYVRAYLGEEPSASGAFGPAAPNVFIDGFATDDRGRVLVRCETPARTASEDGDPLFGEQWHLVNVGQTAFSDRGGVAGADLRMAGAIATDLSGAGVKLGVVDTGLETCHPDLAANAAGGGSFNFAYERLAPLGASPDDPFNFAILGDHGTSVAGIAASVGNNGVGGRGVAPDVTVVGFNPVEAASVDPSEFGAGFETALLSSLGGSDAAPDSASVDVFNMSFGVEAPSENSREEFVRLFEMGTTALRSGRGALYVKAAGNEFEQCRRMHPFNHETGCIAANADPDHNLPWLVVVGGFNADDVKSSYSNAGSSLWIVGPSGEDGVAAPAMITTDQAGSHGGYSESPRNRLTSAHPLNRDGDYVSAFGGTSSATPAVAGSIAVLLGVNPALTWRDVKHILASTARKIDPEIAEVRAAFDGAPHVAQHAWLTNAAGYDFHNWYGFGAVDLDAAVAMAGSHTPDSLGPFVESSWFDSGVTASSPLAIRDADGSGATATVAVAGLPDAADIEAVVVEISADHPDAFDLGVTLRSPAGTTSVINPPFNATLDGIRGLREWRLLSNAFYGESTGGNWTIQIADLAPGDTGTVTGLRLRLYYGEHGD